MKFNPLVLWTDITTLFPMAWAVLRGRYKMPWGTLVWAVLCVIYLASPVDALPDVLPVLGFTDDGAFLIWVLIRMHNELAAFRNSRGKKPEVILEAEVVPTRQPNSKSEGEK